MTPIEELQSEVKALKEQLSEKDSKISHLEDRVRSAEHNAEIYRKWAFGPKSERRADPPIESNGKLRQGHLFEEEIRKRSEEFAEKKNVKATTKTKSTGKTRKSGGRRKKFPPHLPKIRTTLELKPEDRTCCGQEMAEMGEEVTRELESVNVILVHEIARKKYCCRACQSNIKLTPGPDRVIDKGILGVGFLAQVITDRFSDHLPYYRQEKRFADEGIELSRVVLCKSTLRCAEILEPIHRQNMKEVFGSKAIHTDDTEVTELKSMEGGRRKARFWVYTDKEGRIAYDFTESRERDGPLKILKDYAGYIQADAYKGYDVLYTPDGATEVACWAHSRRKFVEAESTSPDLSREAVDRIRELYDIEDLAKEKGLDAAATYRLRQEKSVPLLNAFEAWMEDAETRVLPKSPLAGAIQYARNQWEALKTYTECGILEIDNNRAERALRAIAVGRKNWLHVINEAGGKAASILYSLVQTCKAIGVSPKTYLADVLLRVSHCSDVTTLTPHGWKERWLPEVTDRRQELLDRIKQA